MIPAAPQSRADRATLLQRLRAVDATTLGVLNLSPAMLHETWSAALSGFDCAPRGLDLRGMTVVIIGAGTVYTALLPWLVLLAEAGATVRVKPAHGQERVVTTLAAITGATVHVWKGGEAGPEARALHDADVIIAFGSNETIAALRARAPRGAQFFGFGARFGLAYAQTLADADIAAIVRDVALYDTDGCMSPVGVVTPEALDAGALDALAAAMQAAEQRWPRGAIRPEDAATIRARAFLARAFGQVREGPAWTVLQLPPRLFSPFALPRVLTVYPGLTDLEPYAALLGTVAGSAPDADARRFCALGAMQTPPHDGTHEGIDVLGAIARLPGPTPIST